jgi:hypothetical protein
VCDEDPNRGILSDPDPAYQCVSWIRIRSDPNLSELVGGSGSGHNLSRLLIQNWIADLI